MTEIELENLREGDIVVHKVTGKAVHLLQGFDGNQALGVTIHYISNPSEWDLALQADYKDVKHGK